MNEKLMKLLLVDFGEIVEKFRTAEDELDKYDCIIDTNVLEDSSNFDSFVRKIKKTKKAEHYEIISLKEGLKQKIKAKIEVIALIDGFKGMQKFHEYLYDNNYDASKLFNHLADGIGGWCK